MNHPPINDLLTLRTLVRENICLVHQFIDAYASFHTVDIQHDAHLILSWLQRALPHLESTLVRGTSIAPHILRSHLSAFNMEIDAATFRLNMSSAKVDFMSRECVKLTSASAETIATACDGDLRLDDVEGLAAAVYKDIMHISHRAKDVCRKEGVSASRQARRVLVCCAGDDVEGIGLPLYEIIREKGLEVCLEGHSTGGRVLRGEMHQNAWMGVFILSAEFVRRDSAMSRLVEFQQLQSEAAVDAIGIPVLLPVFYDFGERHGCYGCDRSSFKGDLGVDGLAPRISVKCLEELGRLAGIENYDEACNGAGTEAALRRRGLAEIIADEIEEYCGE